MRALLLAQDHLVERGRRLVVVDPAPIVQRVFELTGLVGTFQMDVSGDGD